LGQLRALVPKFVARIQKELKQKSVKTKVGIFTLLKEFVQVLPNAFKDHTAVIVPAIVNALNVLTLLPTITTNHCFFHQICLFEKSLKEFVIRKKVLILH
jgi:hypothetical protein